MKVRNGFVSNSSSSSFVILGYVFDNLEKLINITKKCVPNEWKQLVYKTVVENGLNDSPNCDEVNVNEEYILDAISDEDLNIYDFIYEIIRLFKFNDYLLNEGDSRIYIGNSIQISGDCDLVIKDITDVKNIMKESVYYDPNKLKIHVLFANHSSDCYESIENM